MRLKRPIAKLHKDERHLGLRQQKKKAATKTKAVKTKAKTTTKTKTKSNGKNPKKAIR